MYGDPDAIRALASRLQAQADEVRDEADRLVSLLSRTRWTGLAADAARTRGRRRAGDLAACAAQHDGAAEALERHAREVEERRALIARAERVAGVLLDTGVELVGSLPPPGHRDWLDVALPGLALPGVAGVGRAA